MIFGRIKDGKIQVQRFFTEDVKKNEGKSVSIEIESESKTLQQLRWLWGVVYKIVSEHTGFTPEEVSEVYKKKFLTYYKGSGGKTYEFTKGLSSLKKDEMSAFIEKVIHHATTELNLIIPEPDREFEYPEQC